MAASMAERTSTRTVFFLTTLSSKPIATNRRRRKKRSLPELIARRTQPPGYER